MQVKVLFMGTPEFALTCFKRLYEEKYDICALFCQPDKPKGRKQILMPPETKVFAMEQGIDVHQPKSLRNDEIVDIIKNYQPDVIVVVAYGKILPKAVLDIPKLGCINVHGSLLPKYRGAAPIQWSIINGEKVTGITTMYMDEGMDTGDIILKEEVEIGENETSGELFGRLASVGADLLIKTLKQVEAGTNPREKQNNDEATYAPMLDKTYSIIDWNKSSNEIHNMIRGLNPWPCASTILEGKSLKIYSSRVSDVKSGDPGMIISLDPFTVGCGNDTSIEIIEVQFEGKKRMSVNDFINGHKIDVNSFLGK